MQCLIDRSPAQNDEEKMQLVQKHMLHLQRAKEGREYLVKCIETAKREAGGAQELGPHEPLSGPPVAHYSFDFAQQVTSDPFMPCLDDIMMISS